jgi:hypothetical protein
MISAQELRIGNWVMIDPSSIPQQVCDVMCDCVTTDNTRGAHYGLVDAIPLTEEWLLKFRFDDLGTYGYGRGNFHICLHGNEFYFPINNRKVFIKYVHQLQNLYFALTGEELIIKEAKK